MDPQEYRDARWHSLVRAAVDMGVADDEAPALVEQVLAQNHRRIRRAEDPDPLVREALGEAILGPRETEHRRRRRAIVTGAVALGVVGTVVVISRPDPPPTDTLNADQVPSLFGYSGPAARDLLESRGFDVTLEPFRACEVLGRVVASDPEPGQTYEAGDPITVYTSLPASVECLPNYTDRVLAWQLLDFANGRGPAPKFADRVFVYADGGPASILTSAQAADPDRWGADGVLTALQHVSAKVALVDERPVTYAVPAIQVAPATDDLGRCGVPETPVAGDADAFALEIWSPTGTGCPVRIDLYLDGSAIEALALYSTPSWSG